MNLQGNRGDDTLRTFVIRTAFQCYSGDHNKKKKMCWHVAWVGLGHISGGEI